VTGSLGILLKAKNKGLEISLRTAISNMQKRGIFLSDELIEKVIKMANE
jgi:predicted nucleic acid-binding protein